MARWNVYRTTPLMRNLDAPDKGSALERARKLWGEDVRVQSVASEAVMRDELSAVRKRRFPNEYTGFRGDTPPAA
jgi:hypothetical protein